MWYSNLFLKLIPKNIHIFVEEGREAKDVWSEW
jgi:hypothetical protein